MIEIQISGVESLLAKLTSAQGNSKLRAPMDKSVKLLEQRMKKYPPQRAGSHYVRTRRLGPSWTTEIAENANGLVGKVGNNTEYGPFVQSQQFQARIHRGRWQTDAQVMESERPTIERYFQEAIDKALNAEI